MIKEMTKLSSLEKDQAQIMKICGPCKHYNDEDDEFCLSCNKVEKAVKALTHKELCCLGARFIFHCFDQLGSYLISGFNWNFLIEPGFRAELPDVFAFTKYHSVLIECKASRADFLKDKKKPFRQNPESGIGAMRFYLVNEGVAKPEEMPEKWQLIEAIDNNTVRISRDFNTSDAKLKFKIRNADAEIELMYSWLYRKQHNCLPTFSGGPVEIVWR